MCVRVCVRVCACVRACVMFAPHTHCVIQTAHLPAPVVGILHSSCITAVHVHKSQIKRRCAPSTLSEYARVRVILRVDRVKDGQGCSRRV